jgi:hypothetical protein
MTGREYILERIVQGRYVKVIAIDTVTGLEVSIVGDASVQGEPLDRVAIRKLEQQLAKLKAKESE